MGCFWTSRDLSLLTWVPTLNPGSSVKVNAGGPSPQDPGEQAPSPGLGTEPPRCRARRLARVLLQGARGREGPRGGFRSDWHGPHLDRVRPTLSHAFVKTDQTGLGQWEGGSREGTRVYLWMSLAGGSESQESACHAGDPGSIPGSGSSAGEGNGSPLQ